MARALLGLQSPPGSGDSLAMSHASNPDRGFRYLAEVIQHAVWLYHCFSLNLRDVETILAARGVMVSYESIREWGQRFTWQFANELRQRRATSGISARCSSASAASSIPLARFRSGQPRAGHPRPKPAQHPGRQAVLPQAAARPAIRASGNRHRQAQELCRCAAHNPAACRAPAEQVPEQPGRGVATLDTTTRAEDAAVQVSPSCPALPVRPRPRPQPLPTPSSPFHCR